MYHVKLKLAVVGLATVLSILSAYADDQISNEQTEQQQQADQKNECLLAARRCGNSATSIQDKIDRLKEEIAKGKTVYTQDELSALQQKLDEVNKTLDFLLDK